MAINYVGKEALEAVIKKLLNNDKKIKVDVEKKIKENFTLLSEDISKKGDASELESVKRRVNQLVKNEGTTVDDVELQDIRIGAKGISYKTAGDSVRRQVKKSCEKINNLEKNNLSGVKNYVFEWEIGNTIETLEDRDSTVHIRSEKIIFGDTTIKVELDSGYGFALARKSSDTDTEMTSAITDPSTIFKTRGDSVYRFVVANDERSEASLDFENKIRVTSVYPYTKNKDTDDELTIETNSYGYNYDCNTHEIWEVGTFGGFGENKPVNDGSRIRTKRFIPSNVEKLVAYDGYKVMVAVYDYYGNYKFATGAISEFALHPDYKYKVVAKKENDGSINVVDDFRCVKMMYGKINTDDIGKNNSISLWEYGTLSNDGVFEENKARFITKDFISKDVVEIVANPGYEFAVIKYDSDGVFRGIEHFFEEYKIVRQDFTSLKIVVRDKNNASEVATFDPSTAVSFIEKKDDYVDMLIKAKSDNSMAILEQQFELKLQRYIMKNGFKINGIEKTYEEIKDWYLNRDNCLYHGALHKKGNRIVDSNDIPVEIRGVGLHHILQYKDLHTYDSLRTLKYYGVNCIRMSAYTIDYEYIKSNKEYHCGLITKYDETVAAMDKIVDNCIKLGLYVIVDFHVLDIDKEFLTDEKYVKTARKFFNHFSTKYANVPNIMYELLNEPYKYNIIQLSDFIKEMRSIIRSNTGDAIIVVGTGKDNTETMMNYFNSEGIGDMFISNHIYTGRTDGKTLTESEINDYLNAYTNEITYHPVFLTEWGNSEYNGDGNRDDNFAKKLLDKFHELCYPNCCWKFTNQDMTTSLLKYSDAAWNKGFHKYGGFLDNDLSENGRIYLGRYSRYAFEDHIERSPV